MICSRQAKLALATFHNQLLQALQVLLKRSIYALFLGLKRTCQVNVGALSLLLVSLFQGFQGKYREMNNREDKTQKTPASMNKVEHKLRHL